MNQKPLDIERIARALGGTVRRTGQGSPAFGSDLVAQTGPDEAARRDDATSPTAYEEGAAARRDGRPEDANPYTPSGHDRDTTAEDERHYQWWLGWSRAEDGNT